MLCSNSYSRGSWLSLLRLTGSATVLNVEVGYSFEHFCKTKTGCNIRSTCQMHVHNARDKHSTDNTLCTHIGAYWQQLYKFWWLGTVFDGPDRNFVLEDTVNYVNMTIQIPMHLPHSHIYWSILAFALFFLLFLFFIHWNPNSESTLPPCLNPTKLIYVIPKCPLLTTGKRNIPNQSIWND